MIRTLHIITDLKTAGAQTVVMNYLRYLKNDEDVSIKVAVTGKPLETAFEKEAKLEGYDITYCNYSPSHLFLGLKFIINWFRYQYLVYKKITEVKPDIVHTHGTALLPFVLLPIIMSHNKLSIHTLHSDPYAFDKITALWAKMAFSFFNVYPVCVTEDQAIKAERRYSIKDYVVIKNGIDENRFINLPLKTEVRKELGLKDDTFIIGCVGRLNSVKNHKFLINIFAKFLHVKPNSILLIVGEGEEKARLVEQIDKLKIGNNVVFLGLRSDVERLYRAMDVFVLTSQFESSSIVTVEAQFAGTRCVISDNIPQNVIVSPLVNRLSLDAPSATWISALENKLPHDKQIGTLSDFSMRKTACDLKNLYFKLLKR